MHLNIEDLMANGEFIDDISTLIGQAGRNFGHSSR